MGDDGNQSPAWAFAPVIKGQQYVLIAFKEEGSALADVLVANKLTAPQIGVLGRRLLFTGEMTLARGCEESPRLVSDVYLPRMLEVDPERCETLAPIDRSRPCILVRWEKIGGVRMDLEAYGKIYAGQLLAVGGHLVAQSDYIYRQAFPTAEGRPEPRSILTPVVRAGLVGVPGSNKRRN